jgi:hypothetical protein
VDRPVAGPFFMACRDSFFLCSGLVPVPSLWDGNRGTTGQREPPELSGNHIVFDILHVGTGEPLRELVPNLVPALSRRNQCFVNRQARFGLQRRER